MKPLLLMLAVLTAAPDNAVLLQQADEALARDDLPAAVKALEEAIENDKEDLDALKALAFVRLEENKPAIAVALLERVVDLDPFDDDARVALAQAKWKAGDQAGADDALNYVTNRHPGFGPAMAVRAQMAGKSVSSDSLWRPSIRAGINTQFDSNVPNPGGTTEQASGGYAATAGISAIGGAVYGADEQVMAFYAYLSARTSLAGELQRETRELAMPSIMGLSATGRHNFGFMAGALDLRYTEIFTKTFIEHLERSFSPTAAASFEVHENHTLRLAFNADIRQPDEGDVYTTLGLFAGDQMIFGEVMLMAELIARQGIAPDETGNELRRFQELGGRLWGEYNFFEELTAYALLDGRGRRFDDGAQQSFATQLGARYTFDSFEVHADYSFSKTFGDFAFDRHIVGLGLRFWYP